jgi:hypothetical protein
LSPVFSRMTFNSASKGINTCFTFVVWRYSYIMQISI